MAENKVDTKGTDKGRKRARRVFWDMTPKAQTLLGKLAYKAKQKKEKASKGRPKRGESAKKTGVGPLSIGGRAGGE